MTPGVSSPDSSVPGPLGDGLAELDRTGSVDLSLDGWGRLHVDRPLPYVAVHRQASKGAGPRTAGARLVTAEASFVVAPSAGASGAPAVVDRLAAHALRSFPAFLTLETRIEPSLVDADDPDRPVFTVVAPQDQPDLEETLQTLRRSLEELTLDHREAEVRIERPATPRSTDEGDGAGFPLRPNRDGCFGLGIEVAPVFRHPRTGLLYPQRLDDLRCAWVGVLRQVFYEFCRRQVGWTTETGPPGAPDHPQALGRREMSAGVEGIDRVLAEVADGFSFLLGVTPVNGAEAWDAFRGSGYRMTPELRYRPLTVDVELEKRRLYSVPLEEIDDPTVSRLFREKQEELDRMLTMLLDRGTPRFLHGSLQVYGEIDPDLVTLARQVLDTLHEENAGHPDPGGEGRSGTRVGAEEFAHCARREVAYYREQMPTFDPPVVVRDDLYRSIMVSKGRFLIGSEASLAAERVEPLLHHEIGTHLLTYYNGRAQPFRQLYLGLAGYEALQEGLAVFAEYLCDGLTASRLRMLAGRVVAVDCLLAGATFPETFRELVDGFGFEHRRSFDITLRVYRGGGFTKDAVYLQGLRDLVAYLGLGGDIEPLYVGKIAETHAPVFDELRRREILCPLPLTPRFLTEAPGPERLERARAGLTVPDLIQAG